MCHVKYVFNIQFSTIKHTQVSGCLIILLQEARYGSDRLGNRMCYANTIQSVSGFSS